MVVSLLELLLADFYYFVFVGNVYLVRLFLQMEKGLHFFAQLWLVLNLLSQLAYCIAILHWDEGYILPKG